VGDGVWVLVMGDWGLRIGPNPQSPIPNPQSPIPNPHFSLNILILVWLEYYKKKYFFNLYNLILLLINIRIYRISDDIFYLLNIIIGKSFNRTSKYSIIELKRYNIILYLKVFFHLKGKNIKNIYNSLKSESFIKNLNLLKIKNKIKNLSQIEKVLF